MTKLDVAAAAGGHGEGPVVTATRRINSGQPACNYLPYPANAHRPRMPKQVPLGTANAYRAALVCRAIAVHRG